MLNRAIQDIFHLRRVHAVLPDAILAETLKNKLLRLSLQPSLQELKQRAQQSHADADADAAGRVATAARWRGSEFSGRRWGDVSAAHLRSPYAIDPSALCNLLDSLAYFHLGSSAVAAEAVQLVQLSAPSMSVPQLCTTLASCCALGAQTDITATALPLLRIALETYTELAAAGPGADAVTSAAFSSPGATSGGAPLLFSQAATVVLLMEALQRAEVKDRQVWHLLAEHCLRYLDGFEGKHLCGIIRVLCAEGIDDYPDFFVAAERHITAQPVGYLSPPQLVGIVEAYKELRQPVVSLLALVNASPLHGEDVEQSITAAAAVAALSTAGGGGATVTAAAVGAMHPSLEAFEAAAISALATADKQAVLDLVNKCEQHRVMTARAMDAILERLLALFYPERRSSAACVVLAPTAAPAPSATVPAPAARQWTDTHLLTQALIAAFSFDDTAFFAHQLPVVADNGATTTTTAAAAAAAAGEAGQKKKPSPSTTSGTSATTSAVVKPAAATVLLDAVADELIRWFHPRVLQLVPSAVRLLPAAAQPHAFFRGVVEHLRRSSDLSSHEGPLRLRHLIDAMLALRPYGGEAALTEYMPAITVAVLNTPRSSQLELTALLAHLPCARIALIPGVYRQWGTQKRWLNTMTEEEVGWALLIMSRNGGLRDTQLLHAVLEHVQAQRANLPPHRVVDYMHQLARLGVRDLEFFTKTAEQVMRRAVDTSPPNLLSSTAPAPGQASVASRSHRASGGAAAAADAAAVGTAGHAPGSGPAVMVRYQRWQMATVHDLCLLLFTFTFVLRESIRATQQIVARLKMCAAAATPRDITRALYSFVKLRVTQSEEVTGQLCERACAILPEFRPAEVASVWSSLRCLSFPHDGLRQRTLEVLGSAYSTGTAAAPPPWRLTDNDCISLAAALLLTESPSRAATQTPLVPAGVASGGHGSTDTATDGGSGNPPADAQHGEGAPALPSCSASQGGVAAVEDATQLQQQPQRQQPLPPAFDAHVAAVCQRLLSTATGQRLYLVLRTLAHCETATELSAASWGAVLTSVDAHAESLSAGLLAEQPAVTQLEVLAALQRLRRCVTDAVGLAEVELLVESKLATAQKSGDARGSPVSRSRRWVAPYCPPSLWEVLRPYWQELNRSVAVLDRPELAAVLVEISGGGGGGAAMAAVHPSAARRRASASGAKPAAARRGRTSK